MHLHQKRHSSLAHSILSVSHALLLGNEADSDKMYEGPSS